MRPGAPHDVRPHQVGWLRRPELDTPIANVWEEPDGTLVAVDPALREPRVPIWPRLKGADWI